MQNTTVTRISRRQGIKQLGVSFSSIFLFFMSMKVARGYVVFLVVRGNPQPLALNGSLRKSPKRIQHTKLDKI